MIMSSSIITRVCWAILFCWEIIVLLNEGYGCFGCPEEERTGLLKIKEAFDYPHPSGKLSSWVGQDQLDCCLWEYVTCDFHSKRVVQLLLNESYYIFSNKAEDWYLNMSLFLPFQQLQNLSLSGNYLRGFIGEFKYSTKLQHLDLSGNSLEEIPPFLKGMKSLTYLNLGDNYLTNLSRFEDLTSLTSLETLNLSGNDINGEIPPFISELTTLKALSLRSSRLAGTLNRKGLCMLRNLEELVLSSNSLTGSIPPCLSNLTSLKLLELSWNLLSGNIPPTLFSNLKSLQYLSLSHNHFEGLFSFSLLSSNSKLQVFELDNHSNELEVDTENPPAWTPLFQLKVLRLSNCKLNEPTHAIPTFLVHQHDLRIVNMSHNGMKGNIPSWLLTNNLNLEFLSLRGNFLTGPLLLYPDLMNLHMRSLDISGNRVQEALPDFIGSILPNLVYLNMSASLFSGSIPPSLGLMVGLKLLDLSNNHFVGEIPESLTMGCTSLEILKLSNNKLQGPLLPPQSNLTSLRILYLDNNQFSGQLPRALVNSSNNLWLLDISNNSISGELPDWLGDLTQLTTLVLSANSFQGQIPPSFCNLINLQFLDLSQNKFTDSIPSSANPYLRYLHLHENNFTGLLPHVLSQSLLLVTLDIRDNQFSGEIPDWITSLSDLRVLVLKNNGFTGSISSAICQLTNIRILDLSGNKFAGLIPPCLSQIPIGNKTSLDDAFEVYSYRWGWGKGTDDYNSILQVFTWFEINFEISDVEEEIKFMTKNRLENYKGGSILRYMSGIDLAENQLVGSIPEELGNLSGIHTLNLSHNQLTSSIPRTFGNMKEIESLDLSYNNLSGSIPSELTQLTFLSVFSVAHNNLSGRTPEMKAQFSTFNKSSFEGNPLLCGPPLEKSCFESPRSSSSSPIRPHEEDSSLDEAFWRGFMISSVVAFSGVVSFLYYSSNYRYKLFSYVEDITGVPLSAGT